MIDGDGAEKDYNLSCLTPVCACYLNRHRRLRAQRVQHVEILARKHAAAILVQKLHDRQRAAAAVQNRHCQHALGAVARVAVDLRVEAAVVVHIVCANGKGDDSNGSDRQRE